MNYEEYQEPPAYSQLYPPSAQVRSDKADLIDKIRPDAIVETIRHKLMGEHLVHGEWVPLPELKPTAITPQGAWDISNLMLGVSSQNVALSKLKDDEIRQRALSIQKTAVEMMLTNWKEYGITSATQLTFIADIVFSNTFITLKQPENGGIRDLLKSTTQESIMHNIEQKPRRWGILPGK